MLIDNRLAKIFLQRRLNQTKFFQSCSISIINRQPIIFRNYDCKSQFKFLLNKSPNSFPTIQIQRELKGGAGYSNIVPRGYKHPPKKYSKYLGIAAAGLMLLYFTFALALESTYDPDSRTTSHKTRSRDLKAETIEENKIEDANSSGMKKKNKKNKSEINESKEESETKDDDDNSTKKKKKHISFKDRKVILILKKSIFFINFL